MKQLTAEEILGADDLKREKVEVPEWGGFVYISTMSGTARDTYESSVIEMEGGKFKENLKNIRAKLVAATTTDDKGNLLFSADQVEALGKKSARALDRLFEATSRINAVSDEDIEELAKNS